MAEPSDADRELMEQLEAELKRMTVSDLLVQTLYTLSSLGYRRLSPSERDLDQARIAIDALRALVPVVAPSVPGDLVRDFNQVVANMQLAYAKAVSEPSPSEASEEKASKADASTSDA